jgi:hypothetical protein
MLMFDADMMLIFELYVDNILPLFMLFVRSKALTIISEISRELPKMRILISLTFAALIYTTHGYDGPLSFKSTTDPDIFTFTILQITDIHLGEAPDTDWGPEQDRMTYAAIDTYISTEKADLILLTGDQLTANNIVDNATSYFDTLGAYMDSHATPWGFIFGNHDDSSLDITPDTPAKTDRRELMKTMEKYSEYGVTRQDSPDDVYGVSNYVLDVNLQESPGLQILLLDTGGGSIPEELNSTQLQWLSTVRRVDIPAVAFQHIPTKEFIFIDDKCVGSYGDESVTPPQAGDAGIVNYLIKDANVMFLSAGHDHGNDYCCPLQQLSICFGKHSGYGGYGTWDKGVRMFELTANVKQSSFTYKSWIQMENGTVINEYAPETKFHLAAHEDSVTPAQEASSSSLIFDSGLVFAVSALHLVASLF